VNQAVSMLPSSQNFMPPRRTRLMYRLSRSGRAASSFFADVPGADDPAAAIRS
jgi:hypothetical protein